MIDLGRRTTLTHLNPDIIWDFLAIDQFPDEVIVGFRCRGISYFDFLETQLHKMSEKAQLLLVGHSCLLLALLSEWQTTPHTIGETLIPVSEISTKPNRGFLMSLVRPSAIGKWDRLEGEVALGGVGAANDC